MRLRDIGEFGFIDEIARAVARASVGTREVVLGIGDDAAILRPRAGDDLVVSTDAVVEGAHFRFATEQAVTVGRRAMLVALSDLSAMGARPLGATVALGAPPTTPLARARGLLRGLVTSSIAASCPIVGGNLARSPVVSIAVTVMGTVRRNHALRRDAARPGDRIFVTGTLGGAALAVARARSGDTEVRHLPPLRLAAGQALARIAGIGACIDVSDGLLADLAHILDASCVVRRTDASGVARRTDASGVGARIDAGVVPMPRGFATACARAHQDPRALALAGGEDCELLFTARARGPSAASLERRLGVRVTEIGRVERGKDLVVAGAPAGLRCRGWSHF